MASSAAQVQKNKTANDSIFQILRMNQHTSLESELLQPPLPRASPQKEYQIANSVPLGHAGHAKNYLPQKDYSQKDYLRSQHNVPLGQGRISNRDVPLGQAIAVDQVLAVDEANHNGRFAYQHVPDDGKFKTELCRNFAYSGACAHGDRLKKLDCQ